MLRKRLPVTRDKRDGQRWYLNLLLIEHAQPLQVQHVGQALSEGQAVLPDLPVQPVVGDKVDICDPVGTGDGDVFPAKFQFDHL